MKLFEELIHHSGTAEELDQYLELNIGKLYSLSNEPYSTLNNEKVAMKHFVATQKPIYGALDFDKSYNKAFISILFDLYERFGFTNIVAIEDILQKKGLSIGTRREAAKLFLMNISDPQNYIDRFEEICKLLGISTSKQSVYKFRESLKKFYIKIDGRKYYLISYVKVANGYGIKDYYVINPAVIWGGNSLEENRKTLSWLFFNA